MSTSRSASSELLAYGALGLPLAFAALPLYVHVPRLYAGLGLSLATVGGVLLAARLVDAITDPIIGWSLDRLSGRRQWIAVALPVLGLGMLGLLSPPAGAGAMWLLALLVLVSLAYSVATIAYNAWGAEVAPTPYLRTRYVASREGFALLRVVLAAVLPTLLAAGAAESLGLARLSVLLLPLLLVFGLWTLWRAPVAAATAASQQALFAGLAAAFKVRGFAPLLAVFAANGIAAAIPSATVLFFVADVLDAADVAGLFLVLYFFAAAASLPLWLAVSRRIGKLGAWLAGMVLAVAVFGWASTIGAGDLFAFGAICLLSGVALGADLSLPPSLLADMLAQAPSAPGTQALAKGARSGSAGKLGSVGLGCAAPTGACFGWWNFVTKANLALAAGLALPLLSAFGYTPGARAPQALLALSLVYAALPVLLKLGAIALLWRWRHVLEPAPVAPLVVTGPTNRGACES